MRFTSLIPQPYHIFVLYILNISFHPVDAALLGGLRLHCAAVIAGLSASGGALQLSAELVVIAS